VCLCRCVWVCFCVCVERHLPVSVAYFQVSFSTWYVCQQLVEWFLVFFLIFFILLWAKYLDYRCRHKLFSSSDTVPSLSPLWRAFCPCLTKCKMSSFSHLCVCVCVFFFLWLVCAKQLFDVCKFCSLSVSASCSLCL